MRLRATGSSYAGAGTAHAHARSVIPAAGSLQVIGQFADNKHPIIIPAPGALAATGKQATVQ